MKRIKIEKELIRKFLHLLELPVLIVYTAVRYRFGEQVASLVITGLLIILLEIEYIRLEHKLIRVPKFIDVLREHEKDNITGSIFFICATIISFSSFPYPIAMIALLMAVFGDLFSALIGVKYGKNKIYKNKSIQGFFGGLIANIAVGVAFLPNQLTIVLPMAFIASLVELFTGKLDDNLTVPLAAGFTGQILVFIFQKNLETFPGPVGDLILRMFNIS